MSERKIDEATMDNVEILAKLALTPLQKNSGFWYWSFRKSVLHFSRAACLSELLLSFSSSDLQTVPADMLFLPVYNLLMSENDVLLNS